MAELIYITNVSLDGYIEDADGGLDWTESSVGEDADGGFERTGSSDEVFSFITDLVRPIGTYLYGRRLYEAMAVWETDPSLAALSELTADFASVWQGADKVVYSSTLRSVPTAGTRLEHRFDPASVRELKASSAAPMTIGGAALAAQAFEAGLVDECHLFTHPVLLGAGKPAFSGDARIPLELVDEHRFGNGVVYLAYRTGTDR